MPYNNRFFVFLTLAVILLMGRDVVSSAPLDNLRRPPQGTLSIISPSNNMRVNSPLTVQGRSTRGAQVEVSIKAVYAGGEQDLGTFKAHAQVGKWETTPIQLWLPEGARNARYQISAVEITRDKTSDPVTVTVLPPRNILFRPVPGGRGQTQQRTLRAPSITSPANNARVTSPLTIQGTSDKNAQIEINVKATYSGGEQDLGTFRASADNSGKWKTTPIGLWLPEGAKNAKYQISATQTVGGKKSAPRAVTVLPPLTVRYVPGPILAPGVVAVPTAPGRRDNSLSITSPAGDAKLGTKITVRGTGVPGANVDVTVRADYKHPVTKALPFDIIPGAKNLVANKIERKYPVKVATNGTWKTHEIDVFAGQDMRSIVDINYQISAVMTYKGADGKEQRKTAIIRGLKGPK